LFKTAGIQRFVFLIGVSYFCLKTIALTDDAMMCRGFAPIFLAQIRQLLDNGLNVI
jgi:hypothetical protein